LVARRIAELVEGLPVMCCAVICAMD